MDFAQRQHNVLTSHGLISAIESGGGGTPVLMIHGNSTSREVFRYQFDSPIAQKHNLIAFDLLGHGASSNASDPHRSYTLPGLADASIALLDRLGVSEVILFGWSLGGHLALEMASRLPRVKGIMVAGATPAGRDYMGQAFKGSPQSGVAGREQITEAEIEGFVGAIFGDSAEPMLLDAVRRSDGRFRKRLFEGLREGLGIDQRRAVETSPTPFAVVNGADDAIVNVDYFDTIPYANLWEGRCYRISGAGHAPFWQQPDQFNAYFARFLADLESA
jgi:pimeloyl-ACP methyl ester carboxylesterase